MKVYTMSVFDNATQYGQGYSHGVAAGEKETKTELGLLLMEIVPLVARAYEHGKSKVILNAVKTALQGM